MQPLVPVFITNAYEKDLDHGRFSAVAVQVDLSGFTHLTTTIMNHERESGGEIVADMMRQTFNPLVDLVDQYGGFIGMFAGDAFTAFFRYTDDPIDMAHAALMAVWKMQNYVQALSLSYSFGEFRFAIKTGVGLGSVDWRIFHNPHLSSTVGETQRTVYAFSGTAVHACMGAINCCEKGDIFASELVLAQFATGELIIGESRDEFYRIRSVDYGHEPVGLLYPATGTRDQMVRPFVPNILRKKTGLGEFRQVVSMFVGVDILEDDLSELEKFAQTIYDLQAIHGGYLNAIRFGDKGYVAVLFWGAPVGYENDVQLAVAFAHTLRQRSPYSIRVGLTYRWLYAGLIGADSRQDYSCYGGGTSFAARLMTSSAYDVIRLDASVANRVQSFYELSAPEKRPFKGFDDEQWIYELGPAKDVESIFSHEQPFVGRDDELTQLHAFVRPIFSDQFAGVFIVRGEAGSGKSRLIAELRQQLSIVHGDQFAWSYCQSDEIVRTDLNPFRYFLRLYFQQSPEKDDAYNRDRFDTVFDLFALAISDTTLRDELERTRSFLAALLGLYWDDSTYSRVSPKLRQPNTEQALVTFFLALSRYVPVVLHIEDAHWLDEASVRLLAKLTEEAQHAESVGGEAYPLAIVITMRDPVELEWEEIAAVLEDVALQFALLGSLSISQIGRLAEQMLSQPVSDKFVSFLRERADGNPFFVEQTILYLQEQGHLDVTGDEVSLAAGHFDIASDVRAVLLARIDRLIPEVQAAVQTASVLGREFRVNVLRYMLASTSGFETHISMAHEANIWVRLLELNYLFRHGLLRDMAYQMQLQSRRQQLHAIAYEAILTLYLSDLRPYYAELAHHAEEALLVDEAIEYLEKAGDEATEIYQNEAAVRYYLRCRHLVENIRTEADSEILFRIITKIAYIYYSAMDKYVECEQLGQEALQIAREMNDFHKIAQAFDLLSQANRLLFKFPIALSYSQHALDYYLSIDDSLNIALHYDRIGSTYRYMGQWEHTLFFAEKALDAIDETVNSLPLSSIYTMLGICWDYFGDYQRSIEFHNKSMDVYRAIRKDPGVANAISNIAFIHSSCGNYLDAIENYEKALIMCKKIGSDRLVIRMQGNLGNVLYRLGRFEEAELRFAEALALSHKIKARFELCWVQAYYADMQFVLKNYAEAERYSRNSLAVAQSLPHLNYTIRAELLLAQVAHEQGLYQDANALINDASSKMKTNAQKANVYYVQWNFSGEDSFRQEALQIYQELARKTPKIDYINRIQELSV